MQLRIFTEPQMGATYDDLLAVARRTEETGFDAFFRSDHYLTMGGDGLPGPTDAWVTLGGLARETSRIRLGTLMTAATFRLPGPLAIAVAQVDQMSGGRVEFGLGAGWFEAEHTAYGIPFPDLGERFDRYEEQLAVITGLWGTPPGETFDFSGTHYRLAGLPGAAQAGAGGRHPGASSAAGARSAPRGWRPATPRSSTCRSPPRRTTRGCSPACARPATTPAATPARWCSARRWCSASGRDDAEVARRAAAIGRDVDELRAHGVAGTPAEAVDTLGRYAEAGATRAYLQVLDLADLDHLDLVAAEVAPQLG